MKSYKVEITDEALRDMEDIYDYIAMVLLDSIGAIRQYNRIAYEILKLDSFPERFPILGLKINTLVKIRRMLIDNYSVFYVIRGERVVVINVLYSASNIESRLVKKNTY